MRNKNSSNYWWIPAFSQISTIVQPYFESDVEERVS